eukprot:scaffold3772_cov390-Prasinococcus_capsulatus_cf.AAC.12
MASVQSDLLRCLGTLKVVEDTAGELELEEQLKLLTAATSAVKALRTAVRLGQHSGSRRRTTLGPATAKSKAEKVKLHSPDHEGLEDDDGRAKGAGRGNLNVHGPPELVQVRVQGLGRYDVYNAMLKACERIIREEDVDFDHCTNGGSVKCLSLRDSTTTIEFRTKRQAEAVAAGLNGTVVNLPVEAAIARNPKKRLVGGVHCEESEVELTQRGVKVGEKEYRFPRGTYLLKLIRMLGHSSTRQRCGPLLDMLAKHRTCHAKEISEVLGMTAAAERAARCVGIDFFRARCVFYCPGDGKKPWTGAALVAGSPLEHCETVLNEVDEHGLLCRAVGTDLYIQHRETQLEEKKRRPLWKAYSIDPRMGREWLPGGDMHQVAEANNLVCVRKISQDFRVPTSVEQADMQQFSESDQISFVLAVHSHCPLQEFWDRVPGRKVRPDHLGCITCHFSCKCNVCCRVVRYVSVSRAVVTAVLCKRAPF